MNAIFATPMALPRKPPLPDLPCDMRVRLGEMMEEMQKSLRSQKFEKYERGSYCPKSVVRHESCTGCGIDLPEIREDLLLIIAPKLCPFCGVHNCD